MDPLGFALENFDAIGEWRTRRPLGGDADRRRRKARRRHGRRRPVDLRKALMRRPDQFVQTVTEKLMTYALGRSVEYYDMPAVRQIVRDAATRQLSLLVDRDGDCEERAVPDAQVGDRIDREVAVEADLQVGLRI